MRKNQLLFLFTMLLMASLARGQEIDALELAAPEDANILINEEVKNSTDALDLSELEEIDDLEALKSDLGDDFVAPTPQKETQAQTMETSGELDLIKPEALPGGKVEVVNTQNIQEQKGQLIENSTKIFDVGEEEKQLLELSKFVETKIPANEWDAVAATAKIDKYVVQQGDWLWKISKKLFGSGFYYSKIWSLNPHITNPHEIEPGMTLVFDTGSADAMPDVKLGSFNEGAGELPTKVGLGAGDGKKGSLDVGQFGDDAEPPWLRERQKLINQGVYFQYASQETYEDLAILGREYLNTEYEKYEPPQADIIIREPTQEYDDTGFDRNSRIVFDVKEGFFLNTFLTTNVVQDLGEIEAAQNESVFIRRFDHVYVNFDSSVKVKPGDKFSIYTAGGLVEHEIADRKGYKYTIVAQIEAKRKVNQVWECEVFELSGITQRHDRVTVYTPRISKITQTFNPRNIEAAIMGAFRESDNGLAFGDVVYLDRGRADGVELGNVFELFSFYDRGTGKRITPDPTYKIGEITVVSLTDNFATALITNSKSEIARGTIALTKTQEQAARVTQLKNGTLLNDVKQLENKALDELDIELNLDDISQDLLDKADKIQLTEDELEELERQERSKSVIKDYERDLKELDRLEKEILEAEKDLNEAKVDEDAFLEQQDLERVEKRTGEPDPNAFESLNEIEQEIGRKFLDEDINARENPYGLTEFDLEEIDDLLNTDVR